MAKRCDHCDGPIVGDGLKAPCTDAVLCSDACMNCCGTRCVHATRLVESLQETVRAANGFMLGRRGVVGEHSVNVMLLGSLDGSRPPMWMVQAMPPLPPPGSPPVPMTFDPDDCKQFEDQADALTYGWALLHELRGES